MRKFGWLLSLVLATAFAAASNGGIYECRGPDGSLSFRDRPCAPGEQAQEHRVQPGPPAPRAPAPGPKRSLTSVVPAPVPVPAGQRYVIDSSRLETPEWQETLAQARKSHRHGTLLRVFLEGATAEDLIQVAGGKLEEPGTHVGGGRYRELPSGGFVLLHHGISSDKGGHSELEVGALAHGASRLWIPVAAEGTVAAGGDVVLGRMAPSQLGEIELRVKGEKSPRSVVVGPLVVGGRYGKSFGCEAGDVCRIGPLAPGSYKLQLPGSLFREPDGYGETRQLP